MLTQNIFPYGILDNPVLNQGGSKHHHHHHKKHHNLQPNEKDKNEEVGTTSIFEYDKIYDPIESIKFDVGKPSAHMCKYMCGFGIDCLEDESMAQHLESKKNALSTIRKNVNSKKYFGEDVSSMNEILASIIENGVLEMKFWKIDSATFKDVSEHCTKSIMSTYQQVSSYTQMSSGTDGTGNLEMPTKYVMTVTWIGDVDFAKLMRISKNGGEQQKYQYGMFFSPDHAYHHLISRLHNHITKKADTLAAVLCISLKKEIFKESLISTPSSSMTSSNNNNKEEIAKEELGLYVGAIPMFRTTEGFPDLITDSHGNMGIICQRTKPLNIISSAIHGDLRTHASFQFTTKGSKSTLIAILVPPCKLFSYESHKPHLSIHAPVTFKYDELLSSQNNNNNITTMTPKPNQNIIGVGTTNEEDQQQSLQKK